MDFMKSKKQSDEIIIKGNFSSSQRKLIHKIVGLYEEIRKLISSSSD